MVKVHTWRKQHKWIGLIISFFIIMFCLSGIILNHRSAVSGYNIDRKFLPYFYRFENWNKGLLRGSVTCRLNGRNCVLLYGNEGCWLSDSAASVFIDFNRGLPEGRDLRALRSVVCSSDGSLFASGQFGCYILSDTVPYKWLPLDLPLSDGERISDMIVQGDSLLVVGRSYLYLSLFPYRHFQRIQLKEPEGYDGKVSLFRTVWQLHNGELFGTIGRLVLDIVAVCLILICISGWFYWLFPRKRILWRRFFLKVHDRVGRKTIVLTLFIAFTGWCLRPPVLIGLVQGRIPAIPGTSLYSTNPWNDKLRMLRYDSASHDWLLSTSDGFYELSTLHDIPRKLSQAPPVSVMGLNVWKQDSDGTWLTGSFSGMFRWNRTTGLITEYTTKHPVISKSGPPFGTDPVAGFISDFHHRPYVVNYNTGCDFAAMPEKFSTLPMSLWDVALEIHSGRIYVFDNIASMIFIFFVGILTVWVLWSGYRIRIKNKRKLNKNQKFNILRK